MTSIVKKIEQLFNEEIAKTQTKIGKLEKEIVKLEKVNNKLKKALLTQKENMEEINELMKDKTYQLNEVCDALDRTNTEQDNLRAGLCRSRAAGDPDDPYDNKRF